MDSVLVYGQSGGIANVGTGQTPGQQDEQGKNLMTRCRLRHKNLKINKVK